MRFNQEIRSSFIFVILLFFKNLYLRFFPKSSYSQESEDLIMRNWLPENSGIYFDIGSGLPIWGSNTYLFYRVGWRGTCIDALSTNIQLARRIRPADTSVHALVGDVSGQVKFWEFDSYEYSTAIESQANLIMQSDRFLTGEIRLVGIRELDMVNINSFLSSCSPNDASLLSLDIEGFDFSLLKIVDWSRFRPRVVCVEDSGSLSIERDTEIQEFLSELSYFRVATTPLSSIYVARDYLTTSPL